MNRLKPSLSWVGVGVLLGCLSAEGWLLRQAQTRAGRALGMLEEKQQERDWLVRQSPAPSGENEIAIRAALADAQDVLARLRDGSGRFDAEDARTVPTDSLDGFFVMAEFVGRMRQRAVAAKVAVRPAEHFGFSSHASEGPDEAILSTVHRQCLAVESLLDALLEARPQALLAIRRERPEATGDARPATGEDFFVMSRMRPVRQPGLVGSDAFRLEFAGTTAALRRLLNALADTPRPVVVQQVEAGPLKKAKDGADQPDPEPWSALQPSLTKFVVTVEIPAAATDGGARP